MIAPARAALIPAVATRCHGRMLSSIWLSKQPSMMTVFKCDPTVITLTQLRGSEWLSPIPTMAISKSSGGVFPLVAAKRSPPNVLNSPIDALSRRRRPRFRSIGMICQHLMQVSIMMFSTMSCSSTSYSGIWGLTSNTLPPI